MNRRSFIALLLAGVILFVVALAGYTVSWTGFGPYIENGVVHREKTFWDWMTLLVAPALIGLFIAWLSNSEKKHEQRIESDRQRQASLDAYINRMTDLLLEEKLSEATANEPVRQVARTLTLTAFEILDANRKGQALQFVYESGLINRNPILQLNGANLCDAKLEHANLSGAELRGVYFNGALLKGASMIETDLSGSNLSGVNLTRANLTRANLTYALLVCAKMQKADLSNSVLIAANITDADLTGAKLQGADFTGTDLWGSVLAISESKGMLRWLHKMLRQIRCKLKPSFPVSEKVGNKGAKQQ